MILGLTDGRQTLFDFAMLGEGGLHPSPGGGERLAFLCGSRTLVPGALRQQRDLAFEFLAEVDRRSRRRSSGRGEKRWNEPRPPWNN